MSESISSEQVLNIFIGAAGREGDAVMHEPGPAGLVVLLQSHFPDYDITVENIGETLRALTWADDCSFTLDDLETFLKKYFSTEGEDKALATAEDHDGTTQWNALADVIAKRSARNEFPLIAPSELESTMEMEAAKSTLSLAEKMEYVELKSFLEERKSD